MVDLILSAVAKAAADSATGDVFSNIQSAIDEGYSSSDPAVREQWEALPFEKRPTPEDVIEYLARKKR